MYKCTFGPLKYFEIQNFNARVLFEVIAKLHYFFLKSFNFHGKKSRSMKLPKTVPCPNMVKKFQKVHKKYKKNTYKVRETHLFTN